MRLKFLLLGTVCALVGAGCADRKEPPAPVVYGDELRAARRVPKPTVMPQKLHVPQKQDSSEKIVLRAPTKEMDVQKDLSEEKSDKIVLRAAPTPSQEKKALPKASDDEYDVTDSLREVEGELAQDSKKSLDKKTEKKQEVQSKAKEGFLPEKPPGKIDAKKATLAPKNLNDEDDEDLEIVEEDELGELKPAAGVISKKGVVSAVPAKETPSLKEEILPKKNIEEDCSHSEPKPTLKPTGFAWPLTGTVLKEFSQDSPTSRNDGLNIEAPLKAPVKASKPGTVVYIGNDIKGFGNLVLVKHDAQWMTAYAHLNSFDVAVGDSLGAGQVLGYVGTSGGVSKPQLHFEVRKNSTPVDPRLYLKP